MDKLPWDSNEVFTFFCRFREFPYKTVHPLRNFLAVLSPTAANLYKVKTREKFWIHAPNIFLWGEGREWVCAVNWKTPQKCKSVQSLFAHDCRL